MTDLDIIFEQRRLNAQAQSIQVPQAFRTKFPDLKEEKVSKLFRKYLDVVVNTLVGRLPFLKDGETFVSTEELFGACGEFRYKTARHFVWNEFKDIYPLLQIIEKGSNLRATNNPYEKNTRVRVVNERFLTMLLEEKSPATVFWHFYEQEDMEIAEQVAIDMENLERFMGNCEIELETATGTAHRAKLQRNLWQAQIVHKIGQFTFENAGAAVLPMVPSPSPFGRTYYKGMNIQNVSKQVRSALIGRHFQYDMNAAVYGIKLYLYGIIKGGDNNLVGTMDGTYTRQYLAEKKFIRERLAKECYQEVQLPWESKVKAIKNALTAIGFGAKTSGSYYPTASGAKPTSLGEILKAQSARDRFLADPWVQGFIAEQGVIEEAILRNAEAGPDNDAMCAAVAAANGTNGRVTRAGKLAWIYQHEEKKLMDVAIAQLEAFGLPPVARIHDAFVVGEKLPARVLDEIYAAWGLRDYLTLDCEEVAEWMDPSFKRALIRADADLAAHKEWIAQEEEKAQKKAALKRAGWQG